MYVFIDGDSIACGAGNAPTIGEMPWLVNRKMKDIQEATGARREDMYGWVESWKGKSIFRKHVAVSKPYKGKRGHKPPWTDEAKMYLVREYGFQVEEYIESEDRMIIEYNRCTKAGHKACMANIDKDCRQAPGLHYDYSKREFVEVSEDQALMNFWTQVITGDTSTDNIPGLPGVGEAFVRDHMEGKPASELPRIVAEAYAREGYPRKSSKAWPYAYFLEQCRLLYLLRRRHEPPFTPLTEEEYNA